MLVTPILTYYFILQLFALAGLPLALAWLHRLPSRGYAAAKALGLLLSGVVFWWGCILHLWANNAASIVTSAVLVFALGLWLLRGHWGALREWWTEHWAWALTTEVLFLAALVFWALVRAAQPQIETAGGEKWMEIAFLNAVLRSPSMPPHDPWLSGYAISYYYLGYVLMGMLARLSALPPTVAFNLSCAGWYALASVGAYGVLYDLIVSRGGRLTRIASASRLRHVFLSLLGPLMLLLTGNAEGFFEVLHARGLFPANWWSWLDINNLREPPQPPFSWVPQRFFWWWQASRTLQDYTPAGTLQEVIDEFPAFSFILGDMHPHVLALPFVLLIVTLALNLHLRGTLLRASWWRDWPDRFVSLGGYAVLLGTLGFLNTWDLPIYWILLAGALVLGSYPAVGADAPRLLDRVWALVPEAGVLGALSIALYFPFWYALRSQAGGILPNLFNAARLPQFLVMFAPLLVPVAGVLVTAVRQVGVKLHTVLLLGVALVVGIALAGLLIGAYQAYPYLMMVLRDEPVAGLSISPEMVVDAILKRVFNPWTGLLLAFGISGGLLVMFARYRASPDAAEPVHSESDQVAVFPLLLAILGLLLTFGPEFVYLKDIFMVRMNTIFKFYFQAWVMWSLVGAWQLACWLAPDETPRRARAGVRPSAGWRHATAGLSLVLIAVGLVYTALAIPARAKEHGVPWTLDGSAWLEQREPGDLAAIRWINENIDGAPVLVETPGDGHKAYVYEARIAAFTGLPTVLGWGGHERQWRGNYDEPAVRETALEQLFTTTDPQLTLEILERYDVTYVYLGPTEWLRYPAAGLEKFEAMFPKVYAGDGTALYRVKP